MNACIHNVGGVSDCGVKELLRKSSIVYYLL